MARQPRVDPVTVVGTALLLMPLLTMAHEIGGHAAACAAVGGKLTELGAFYVECAPPGETARRIVAVAGVAADTVLAAAAYTVWRRLSGDYARLVGWYVWLCLAFSASGYLLFSGVSGIGDLGPDDTSGIGPLPYPLVWRVVFALLGGGTYVLLVRTGMRALDDMIGQGLVTKRARRTIAHGFYAALCVSAVLASLPNPVGLFVTLASATAASFGGKAGLISIGYATHEAGIGRPFTVQRNWLIFALGAAASAIFAGVLGPTLRFG